MGIICVVLLITAAYVFSGLKIGFLVCYYSRTSIIPMGCQLKKGVGLSTAHVQSHMAKEKGACLLTAHVQSYMANTSC